MNPKSTTPSDDAIKARVIGLIGELEEVSEAYDGVIGLDADLGELGISSIALIKLFVLCEEAFDVEFGEEVLAVDKLESVEDFCGIVIAGLRTQTGP